MKVVLFALVSCFLLGCVFASTESVEQHGGCTICQLIVQTVENLINENKTIGAIQKAVLKVCQKLPSPLNKTCVDIVEKNIQNIVQWLEQQQDPGTICTRLHFCTQSDSKSMTKEFDGQCGLCKAAMKNVFADGLLKSSACEDHAVRSACKGVPHPMKTACAFFFEAKCESGSTDDDVLAMNACAKSGLCL